MKKKNPNNNKSFKAKPTSPVKKPKPKKLLSKLIKNESKKKLWKQKLLKQIDSLYN
jgi:hypothetical protein